MPRRPAPLRPTTPIVRGAIAALAVGASACDGPAVSARAIWLDGEHVGGTRQVHVYSRGALTTTSLRAADDARDPGAEVLRLALAPGGGGALVMIADASGLVADGASVVRAGYFDLSGVRALPLALPLDGVTPTVPSFAAAGDALWWVEPCASTLAVVPLTRAVEVAPLSAGGRAVVPLRLPLGPGAGDAPCPLQWDVASAASGAIAFAIAGFEPFVIPVSAGPEPWSGPRPAPEGRLEPLQGGELVAFRYPGRGAADEGVAEVARGRLLDGVAPVRVAGCVGDLGCLGLVDPEGSAVSVVNDPSEICRIQRWSWIDGADAASCVWEGPGDVIAAISARHYVIKRSEAVTRVDWVTGEEVSLPLLGVKEHWQARVLQGGAGVAMVSSDGPMLRLAPERVEIVSIEQTSCPLGQPAVVSPSGRWAAWVCSNDFADGLTEVDVPSVTSVIRVGVHGLERYDGVPMWALAIDDGGDLLLFSRGDDGLAGAQPSSSPRNLYVLRSDGELSRVDTLEPDPELSMGLDGRLRWIDAAPLPSIE